MRTIPLRLAGLLAGLLTLIGLVAPATATAKGGWATVSYDPLPALVAGAPVDVSFRVLQHGVAVLTPDQFLTDPNEPRHGGPAGLDVIRLDVTGPVGTIEVPTDVDAQGRFTASFTVPAAAETVDLAVVWDDGLFLQQEPIAVPVAPPPSPAFPGWLPFGFGAVAMAGAGLLVTDLRARRRAARALSATDPELVPA